MEVPRRFEASKKRLEPHKVDCPPYPQEYEKKTKMSESKPSVLYFGSLLFSVYLALYSTLFQVVSNSCLVHLLYVTSGDLFWFVPNQSDSSQSHTSPGGY